MNNNNNPEKKEKKIALDESPVPHVNKAFAITAICLFLAVLVLPTAVWGSFLLVENYAPGTMDACNINPPTSEFEKHYLEFPKEFDITTFPTEFEAWFNDNLPFRSHLFNSNEKIMSNLEKPYEEKWRDVFVTMFQDNKNPNNPQLGIENTETFQDYFGTTEAEETTTETETLPKFDNNESSDAETLPIYIETNNTENDNTDTEIETTSEEDTPPPVVETTEEDTPPPVLETTEESTLPTIETEEEEYTEVIESEANEGDKNCEHDYTITIEKAANCSENGIIRYTCIKCHREYTAKTPISHNYGEIVIIKEPSCTELGEKGYQCADCGNTKLTEYLHKAEHNYGEEIILKAPTCTEFGEKGYQCVDCGAAKLTQYINKEHKYGEETILKASTCTEFGEKGYRCSVCGDIKLTEYLNKAPHSYGDVVVEAVATCVDKGINLSTCTVCGNEKREYTNKLDHQWSNEFTVWQPATCTDYGVEGRKCANCDNYTDKRFTAKADHTYGSFTIETQPTCTELGVQVRVCSACQNENREYVQKLGHNYVSSVPERPICGTEYTETLTCSRCNDTSTNTLTATHEIGKKLKVVQATTETYGYTLVRCKHCDGEFRTDIKGRLTDTSNFLTINRSRTVNEGKFRWLFYLGDNSKAYYDGTNSLTDEQMASNAAILDQLNELCKAKGITLQIAIWPNKDQVYAEFTGYENATLDERKNARTYKWVKYVQDNTDVKIVYPLEELWAMKPYFDVYCKYDTHWNTAGGFIGYQAMLKSLGLDSVNILDCPVFEYTGGDPLADDHYYRQLKGDMLGMDGWTYNGNDYPAHRNYYIKYLPHVKIDSKEGIDFENKNMPQGDPNGNIDGAGDTRHTTAANATYDKKFVMLADSFRVMQLGYIEKDFSDCFMTHRGKVNHADTVAAIKNLGEGDILVIAAVERYDQDTVNTAQHIINILSQ